MMKILQIGLIASCLLLLGACSARPPKDPPVTECVPDVEIITKYVPVPSELTQVWYNPAVPSSGDNLALLDWAQACAVTTYLYTEQMKKLKELK